MTPEEKAKLTLDYLRGGDGRLTDKQAERFVDYAMQIMKEQQARWKALPWHRRAVWRIKATVRGWFGMETWPPWVHVIKTERSDHEHETKDSHRRFP